MIFEEINADPEFYFENSYITNFDLIHHECRGDRLSFSRKYYETISYKKFNQEITDNANQQKFISSAIKSERKDVFIEKKLTEEHFNGEKIDDDLKKRNFSFVDEEKSLLKKKKTKKKDDCKSLFFKKV